MGAELGRILTGLIVPPVEIPKAETNKGTKERPIPKTIFLCES